MSIYYIYLIKCIFNSRRFTARSYPPELVLPPEFDGDAPWEAAQSETLEAWTELDAAHKAQIPEYY